MLQYKKCRNGNTDHKKEGNLPPNQYFKHYAWYLKGVPYAGYYKEQISKISTLEDIDRITAGIQRDLRD